MERMHRVVGAASAVGIALSLAACGGGSGAGGGGQETARLSSYLQKDTAMGQAVIAWADQVEKCSDGQIKFERFHGGSLFGATETRDAVSSGQVEVGAFSPGYHPGEFPLTQGLFNVPFLSSNVPAIMDALDKMYEETPAARSEWTDQNMYRMTMMPVTPVPIGTNKPFDSLDDLEGLDIRGYPAGGVNAALEAAGAKPVDMTLSQVPQGMQRGVIDGFAGISIKNVSSLSLQESAKYLTEPGFASTSSAALAVNKQWWDGLPDDVQACGEKAAANLDEPYMEALAKAEDEACAELKEADVKLSVLPEAETNRWRDMIQSDQRELWIESAKGEIDDPKAYLADYKSALNSAEGEHQGKVFGIERCLK